MNERKLAMRVLTLSISLNVFLAVFKMIAGVLASSGALRSDAAHSAADVLATLVVLLGVSLSRRAPDADHPYGHQRMECIASLVLGGILLITAYGIGREGFLSILHADVGAVEVPGTLALVAALCSIGLKEMMFWYTRGVAARIHSDALRADAWHHRADALASLGGFVGVLGARLGQPMLDPIASVFIALLIAKAGLSIFRESCQKLVDRGCDPETLAEVKEVIADTAGVLALDELRTRQCGARFCLDVAICADEHLSFSDSHEIAKALRDSLLAAFPQLSYCTVRIRPNGQNRTEE